MVTLGDGKQAMQCVVSDSLRGNSHSGPQSMVQTPIHRPYEREGATAVYRLRVLLPSGTDARYPGKFHAHPPAGQPASTGDGPGAWNTFLSFHEKAADGIGQVGGMSPALGRSAWQGSPGCLQMKWVGGRGFAAWIEHREGDGTGKVLPLRFDHWYDIVLRVLWSGRDDGGFAECWVDGQKWFGPGYKYLHGAEWRTLPARWPTLWRHEDGRTATCHTTVGHYRRGSRSYPGATRAAFADYGDDTIYMDEFLVGPTLASVGA